MTGTGLDALLSELRGEPLVEASGKKRTEFNQSKHRWVTISGNAVMVTKTGIPVNAPKWMKSGKYSSGSGDGPSGKLSASRMDRVPKEPKKKPGMLRRLINKLQKR